MNTGSSNNVISTIKRGWRERIPHTWASSDENYLKPIFGSVSYCVVILRTTPHWLVGMTSCNFGLFDMETIDKNILRSMGAN